MSSRQDNLTFRILSDMTLKAFNSATYKSDCISEWQCNYVGNVCGTLTTNGTNIVNYDL
jgi:hypothetical protein